MLLRQAFYERDPIRVAKELLGKTLVHETHGEITSGKIVEVEAYMGPEDKASHAYNNLRTKRTEIQFGPKGHAYIYLVYGMYYCLNVTVGRCSGKPEAVLIRTLEPLEGIELMKKRRPGAHDNLSALTNGPGKLCMAMGLSKKQNGSKLYEPPFYIRNDGITVSKADTIQTSRIGVEYADEWKLKPWRFYIRTNPFVSVTSKSE
jgi:DNA-3-methyladenine glycosylase